MLQGLEGLQGRATLLDPALHATDNQTVTVKYNEHGYPDAEASGVSWSSEPMSEYEEKEWKRIEQIMESQKRGKESI